MSAKDVRAARDAAVEVTFADTLANIAAANGPRSQGELQLVHYDGQECQADFTLDAAGETLWATQAQIAAAFGISASTVRGHLTNIFKESELDEGSVAREFRAPAADGKIYKQLAYSLDAIIAVGYRVSSKRGTAFRRWATQVIKDYIVQGFAIDEARLKSDPAALQELAAKVRELRSSEANIYRGVRDVFAFGSSDYDKGAPAVRMFYTKLQDKFLYAVTGKTAAQVLLDRADHKMPSMGLTAMKGSIPERVDAGVGKNYLLKDELYVLHILCEQFLLFVESKAIRGQQLTMAQLAEKFDELLKFQGHAIFPGYRDAIAARANAHAQREFDLWRERVRHLPRGDRSLA